VGIFDRFELLELLRDDGIRTFRARETATGKPVQVHLFPLATAQNVASLARLDHLPERSRRNILDRGEQAGVPYVVTRPLGDRPNFREWLAAQESTPDQVSDETTPPPVERLAPPVAIAAKSVLAITLGVAAAVLFLVVIIVLIALRPR
jgi:hypothetical protein